MVAREGVFPVFYSASAQILLDGHDQVVQPLVGNEVSILDIGDRSRFLTHHQANGIGFFGNAHGGTVPQPKTQGNVAFVGYRQYDPGGGYKIVLDHDGPIVQGAILEENTFQNGLGDLYVHGIPGRFDKVQGIVPLDHDQRPGLGAGHTLTGTHNGGDIRQDGDAVLLEELKMFQKIPLGGKVGGADHQQEFSDLLLEDDDQGDEPNVHKTADHTTDHLHLQQFG